MSKFSCARAADSLVIDYAAILIAWILLFPRLKCVGRVNEIEIEIVEL
jgi:hypothetical protein